MRGRAGTSAWERFSAKPWYPGLAVLLGVVLIRAFPMTGLERLEMQWLDASLRMRLAVGQARPLDNRIRIVELGIRDLDSLGEEEGEYAVAADALRTIASMGAKVIAVDVLYTRGSKQQQEDLRAAIDEIENDGSAKIVMAASVEPQGDAEVWQRSLPLAEGDELRWGSVNMEIDPDRLWRRYALTRPGESGTYPSLALATFGETLAQGFEATETPGEMKGARLSDDFTVMEEIVFDAQPRLLNFRHSYFSGEVDRKSGEGRRIWGVGDLRELAAGIADDDASSPFSGAVVFFGYGSGVDEKATCMGAREPGIFMHAQAFSDLAQDSFLARAPAGNDILALVIVGLAAMACFRLKKMPLLVVAGAIGFAAIIGIGLWLIWSRQVVPGTVLASATWAGLFVVEIGRRQSVESRKRIRLDATMGYYFSPRVKEFVLENSGSMEPKEAELTVLITDVRNFTTLCERIPVQSMVRLLSRAYEVQTTAVMEEDGNLQHFLGDQFTAYWGAPQDQPDAADRAYRASGELMRLMESLRSSLADEFDLPPETANLFNYGVGMNRATGIVGNIGSEQYLDYNIFGDVVNAAARIESLTKFYGVKMLVTRGFADGLTNRPVQRTIDEVRVKGKSDSLELVEIAHPLSPDGFADICSGYEEAMTHYRAGEFRTAAEAFSALGEDHDDGPSRALAGRCRDYEAKPPADWDGVFTPAFK